MIIYVLRHGEAEALVSTDEARSLTVRGVAQVGAAAACLAENGPLPGKILFSPFVRTRETFDTVIDTLGDCPSESAEALLPESSPAAVDQLLQQQDHEVLLLISHQPLVSYLLGHWLRGDPGDHSVPGLYPAGLVKLELTTPASACGQLQYWALPPDFTRQH